MILVYTHKVTPRVRYIFKHIFTRILHIPVEFTTKVENFVAHNGSKMSYTNVPLGGEFFVKSTELLFEQGVNDLEINVHDWNNIPCFFQTGEKSSVPFDIFSASFYLITRYEEYLPHVKDEHERFKATDSLAYRNGFLEKPVIDIWAYRLQSLLKDKFPDYEYKKRKFEYISTINVSKAYAFKYKNIVRTLGLLFMDFLRLRIIKLVNRLAVLFNFKKDPFDNFDHIISLKKEYSVKTIFFFLVANYTTFDNNISYSKQRFRLLIKDMVDYARVGLSPSYFTLNDEVLLKKEKERLEGITNMPVSKSRQHYLRFSLPKTYQQLIDLEVLEDYSMGYVTHTGFRASTCTPFYFYDLEYEIKTPLKIFSFPVMDITLNDYLKLTPKQSLGKIRDLKNEVKAVNGTFITVFHNESLGNFSKWKGWQRLYSSMLKIVKA